MRFTGGIYGTGYRELQSHAAIYIHATEVGGTHPALIEAMGAGNCVIVYDTPENREVIGDCGLLFKDAAELSRQIQKAIDDPASVARFAREGAGSCNGEVFVGCHHRPVRKVIQGYEIFQLK